MVEQDSLPPLPPPLPPTHSRSFSSSSSSSSAGGSPRPSNDATVPWGALPTLERRDSAASTTSSVSTSASESRRRRNAARSEGSSGAFNSLGHARAAAPKPGQPPALTRTLSAASTSSSSSTGASPRARFALSTAAISAADLDFPRSSTLHASMGKLPSPTSNDGFHPHAHHTTASLGLGGSPSFPSPSAFFASRAPPQQLPSPPRTASDSGTLRHTPAAVASVTPLGPERPPRREARRVGSMSSAGGSPVKGALDGEEEVDEGNSPALEPRRRLRPRGSTALDGPDLDDDSPSAGAGEADGAEDADDAECRRERRARRADDWRVKNQRILDSINGVPSRAADALRRSSTTSTLRDFGAAADPDGAGAGLSLADEQAPAFNCRTSAASSWLEDTHREFGARPASAAAGTVPRSRTLGDLSRARVSVPAPAGVDSPRASTALGGSLRARATPRRSEVLLASRAAARAATALGGTTERDAILERGLRASASTTSGAVGGAGARWGEPARERVRSEGVRRAMSRVELRGGGARGDEDEEEEEEGDGLPAMALRRHVRAATASPTLAVRRLPGSLALATPPPGSRAGRRAEPGAEEDEEDEETTPKSGKKRGSKESGGSAGGGEGRYSRLSGVRSGTLGNGFPDLPRLSTSSSTSNAPPPPLSARSDDRFSSASNEARRERLKGVEVGSDAWMAEFDEVRRRTVRSRASGSNGDAASSARSQTERDRDRTIRAINALLAGQGIVAAAASTDDPLPQSPASSTSASSPQKRQGYAAPAYTERPRRISSTGAGAVAADLVRMNGTPGRAGSESVLKGLFSQAGSGAEEHHRLLFAALEQFDAHFSAAGGAEDLVKRMDALVGSTTRLNTGLRGLAQSVRDAQVAAQLDEGRPGGTSELGPFERSVSALLRASDDQVRCLSEDLVAFARVDRERERDRLARGAREGSAEASRPVSRASTYRSSLGGGAMNSPPKRAATASPFERGTLVSHASARSPSLAKEVLRDPLSPQLDGLRSSAGSAASVSRRHTLGYASAARGGPFAAQDSPTPMSGRRESAHVRSPLAAHGAFETPSRAASAASVRQQSIAGAVESLAGLGLPLPHAAGTGGPAGTRRSKTSDTTVRPSSPSAIRFPTHTDQRPTTLVDSSSASTHTSPTHAPPLAPFRAYSDPDETRALRALELGANLDEEYAPSLDDDDAATGGEMARQPSDAPSLRTRNRDLPDLPANVSPPPAAPQYAYAGPVEHILQAQESPSGRKSRLRISSGGLGAALKNALTRGGGDKRSFVGGGGASDVGGSPLRQGPPPVPAPAQGHYPNGGDRPGSVASTVDDRRVERRKEVEGILRKAGR